MNNFKIKLFHAATGTILRIKTYIQELTFQVTSTFMENQE